MKQNELKELDDIISNLKKIDQNNINDIIKNNNDLLSKLNKLHPTPKDYQKFKQYVIDYQNEAQQHFINLINQQRKNVIMDKYKQLSENEIDLLNDIKLNNINKGSYTESLTTELKNKINEITEKIKDIQNKYDAIEPLPINDEIDIKPLSENDYDMIYNLIKNNDQITNLFKNINQKGGATTDNLNDIITSIASYDSHFHKTVDGIYQSITSIDNVKKKYDEVQTLMDRYDHDVNMAENHCYFMLGLLYYVIYAQSKDKIKLMKVMHIKDIKELKIKSSEWTGTSEKIYRLIKRIENVSKYVRHECIYLDQSKKSFISLAMMQAIQIINDA